jgi:hypothetical protein
MTATMRPAQGTLTARLDEAARLVASVVADLQPELMPSDEAGPLLDRFVALGKRCDAGRTLVAARATAGNEWRERGVRTREEWLARKTGTTTEAAKRTLAASEALGALEGTTQALKDGRLSAEQTAAVTSAACANPRAEPELLRAASTETLQTLKSHAARVRAAADPDPERTAARIHRTRSVRFFDDTDGARCGFVRGPRDVMASFEARVMRQREQVFDHARRDGRRESPDAYAFDALMALADPDRTPVSSGKPEMLILADLPPLVDGHLHDGETIEIPGVGPYPLAAARERLFGDATLRLVVRDGVDVANVVTDTRNIRTVIEAAVRARDRGTCVVPGCGRTRNLQIHHVGSATGFADTKTTRFDQLALVDLDHHDDITHRGAELTGGHTDGWIYQPPDPARTRARDRSKRKQRARAAGRSSGPDPPT